MHVSRHSLVIPRGNKELSPEDNKGGGRNSKEIKKKLVPEIKTSQTNKFKVTATITTIKNNQILNMYTL